MITERVNKEQIPLRESTRVDVRHNVGDGRHRARGRRRTHQHAGRGVRRGVVFGRCRWVSLKPCCIGLKRSCCVGLKRSSCVGLSQRC